MRTQASFRWEEMKAEIKEIRERAEGLQIKRLLEAKARAVTKGVTAEDASGAGGERTNKPAAAPPALVATTSLKPTAVVPPTLVPPLSYSYPPTARTPAVVTMTPAVVTPHSPPYPPPASSRGPNIDLESSEEEEEEFL